VPLGPGTVRGSPGKSLAQCTPPVLGDYVPDQDSGSASGGHCVPYTQGVITDDSMEPETYNEQEAQRLFDENVDAKKLNYRHTMMLGKKTTLTVDSKVVTWLDTLSRVDSTNPKSPVKITATYQPAICDPESPNVVCGDPKETGLFCVQKSFFSQTHWCIKAIGDGGDRCNRKGTVKACGKPFHCLRLKLGFSSWAKGLVDKSNFACQATLGGSDVKEMQTWRTNI